MDVERTLISKAIQAGEMETVISRGIEEDHFADPDCAEIYTYTIDFMRRHKSTPSMKVIKKEFPKFEPVISSDPLTYHVEEFVRKVKYREAVDLARDYMGLLDDPDEMDEIEIHALEMARILTEVVPAPRASRFSDKQRKEEYDRRKAEGHTHGLFIGVPTIDEATNGLQHHELATYVAYMGVGKSTGLQHTSYSFYLQDATTLFISLEMEAEALLRKLDTMASKVKYAALKALELDVGEREQWERILEQAYKDRHEKDIIIIDDIRNCTPDHVMSRALRYKPDAVIVDYLELMSKRKGSSHWEAISEAGIALKQNARLLKIPHLTAAQLTREGGKGELSLANIGYQSVGKHSDIVIGLRQDEEAEARSEMELILLKNRDGKKNISVDMRWEMERMNIKEKGIEERFPAKHKRRTKESEQKRQRLELARVTGGAPNVFSHRAGRSRNGGNPFSAKARARR